MGSVDETIKAEIAKRAADLALAYADPAKLAAKLAAWVRENYPDRVSSALWITAKGDRDRGISVELREVPLGKRLRLQASGLIGKWSAGLALSKEIGTYRGATVSVGAGAIVPYADLSDIAPVAVVKVRF